MTVRTVACAHRANLKTCLTCWPKFAGTEDRTNREMATAVRNFLHRFGVPTGDLDQTDLTNLKGALDAYARESRR